MSGYSKTPLVKKLGFKAGMTIQAYNLPVEYKDWLGELPADCTITQNLDGNQFSAVHIFVTEFSDLQAQLGKLRKQLQQDGFIWVSWPKKASKVPTSVTEDAIRAIALPMGFVDIKVCAVSEVWSGLKLVIRKSERNGNSHV